MSVKSTVFILCCIGASLSHPLNPLPQFHNDHFTSDLPTKYPGDLNMDQMDALIAKNFDYPSIHAPTHIHHTETGMRQSPMEYLTQAEPHTFFGNHGHGIGRPPVIPDDVEVIHAANTPLKPSVPFGPNFNDVELIGPNSGKPVSFPQNYGMIGSGEMIMEREIPVMRMEHDQIPSMMMEGSRVVMPELGGSPIMHIHDEIPQHFVRTMTARDDPRMMAITNERAESNMIPMMVERDRLIDEMPQIMRERTRPIMMPTMIVRDNMMSEMPREMPSMREEMRPLTTMERDSIMASRENMNHREMMPMMVEERLPQTMTMDRTKRHENQMVNDMPPNSFDAKQEIENELENKFEEIIENNSNYFNRKPSIGLMNDETIPDTQLINEEVEKQTTKGISTTASIFDSKNEIKNQELASINKLEAASIDETLNDEQSKADQLPIKNSKPNNVKVIESSSTPMSIFDSKNEIKNKELAAIDKTQNDQQMESDQPSKYVKPTDGKVIDESSKPMTIFDSKNEIKNKELAAIDKTQNDQHMKTDQPSEDVNPTDDKEIDESSKPMTIFDSKNEIKNKELAAIDKTQNDHQMESDQPSKDVKPTDGKVIDESSKPMTIFDSKNEIKNKELAAIDKTQNDQHMETDQPSEDVNPTDDKEIDESSKPMTIFDSKNEIKNKELAAIDKTQNDQQMESDQPSKDVKPTDGKVIDESSKPMTLFDSKNEIKNKELAAIDKTQNDQHMETDQPSEDVNPTDDKEIDESSKPMTIFDSKNEIKNKELAAIDKTQNDQQMESDQPSKDVKPTDGKVIDESSKPMTLFDSKNEIKNKELAAIDKTQNDQHMETDQPSEDVNPTDDKVIDESSKPMTIFDSKNEIKNKELAAIDKTQNDQQAQTDHSTTTDESNHAFEQALIDMSQSQIPLEGRSEGFKPSNAHPHDVIMDNNQSSDNIDVAGIENLARILASLSQREGEGVNGLRSNYQTSPQGIPINDFQHVPVVTPQISQTHLVRDVPIYDFHHVPLLTPGVSQAHFHEYMYPNYHTTY